MLCCGVGIINTSQHKRRATMENNGTFGKIVKMDANGNEQVVAILNEQDYYELERALQWPEDLPKWDRFNTPIEAGLGKNGLVFLNL